MWERGVLTGFWKEGCSSLLAIYFSIYLYAFFCLKAYSLKVKQHQSSLLTLFSWNQKMKIPETFNLVLAFISQQNSQNKVQKSQGSYLQDTKRQSAGSDLCFCQNPWNGLNRRQDLLHSQPLHCVPWFPLPNNTAGRNPSPPLPGAADESFLTFGLFAEIYLFCSASWRYILNATPFHTRQFFCSL